MVVAVAEAVAEAVAAEVETNNKDKDLKDIKI
jgi:hypothetical protein